MNTFFFHLTQRIETFDQEIWLKELNRVSKKDSKNGTLFKGLIELNLFLWTSSQYDSKSWSLSFQYDAKNWTFLVFQYDSRNWTFSKCSRNWTSLPYELLFYMTRIELFFDELWVSCLMMRLRVMHFRPIVSSPKRAEFFTKNDSKCWTPFWIWLKELNFFLHWTKRIELFSICLKELSLFLWVQELNFFQMQKWPSQKNDSKNWTFSKHDSQNRIPLKRKRLKELNPLLFFFSMTQRIELFVNDSLNWASFMNLFSMRVEFFFFWLKELNFLNMTQRIEPTFFECDFFFQKKKKTQKIELFSKKVTQIIEPFWTWLNELNLL